MSTQGVCFEFEERMAGPVAAGATDPAAGAELGRKTGAELVLDLRVRIADLEPFFRDPTHRAELSGCVWLSGVASGAPVESGSIEVYLPASRQHAKLIRYTVQFRGRGDSSFLVYGIKVLHTPFPPLREQITLYTRIYEGDLGGPLWGAGILTFRLRDFPAFLRSMRAQGGGRLTSLLRFIAFAQRELLRAADRDLSGEEPTR